VFASVLFLLSCVMTARFLERQKMRIANVLYSVLFASTLCVLAFVFDFPWLKGLMSYLLGESAYNELHIIALRVVSQTVYGVSVMTMISVIFSVQLGIAIYTATKKIVHKLTHREPARKLSRVYSIKKIDAPSFHPVLRINQLYCRMLN